jgi:hypothetical protein
MKNIIELILIRNKKESTFISDNKSRLYKLAVRLNEIEKKPSQKKLKNDNSADANELVSDLHR